MESSRGFSADQPGALPLSQTGSHAPNVIAPFVRHLLCSGHHLHIPPGEAKNVIVQELCKSRGGRPGLSVLTSLLVSVDVKIY